MQSGILFWLDGLDGNGVELAKFCGIFVIILCLCGHTYDMLELNLMGSSSLQPQSSQWYANNQWVKCRCIFAYSLISYFSLLLPYISFISYTCWVPTISVLNLAIFPCYSNLMLRRRRWTGILQRGVLGYASPQLPFLWCYRVFRYSVSLRVILVFKDIIYVTIIRYVYDIWLSVSTFGFMCGTFDPGSCIRWVLSFGVKNRVWQKWYQSRVNHRNSSLVTRVLSLILSSSICESTLF
jgi:hypothetical protein